MPFIHNAHSSTDLRFRNVTHSTPISAIFARLNVLNLSSSANYPALAVVLLFGLAIAYWVLFGLTTRNINTDEARSIIAAQSILEHGYQLFPSGFIYLRGFVPHYLLAGSIFAFGENNFSLMLPSLLFSLGSLWLVYKIAKDVLGRPWLGVIAVALMIVLQNQTFYATSPRMYMSLQFFTTLAIYGAWRGYTQGSVRFRVIAFLAVALAVLSHKEGLILGLVLPLAVISLLLLRRQRLFDSLSITELFGFFIMGAVAVFVLFYSPVDAMPLITIRGGVDPSILGNHLSLLGIGKHVRNLELILPLGIALFPIAIFAAIASFKSKTLDENHGLKYLIILFLLISFTVLLTLSKGGVGPRTWMFVLPIYAITVTYGLVFFVETIIFRKKASFPLMKPLDKMKLVAILSVGFLVSISLASIIAGPNLEDFEGDSLIYFGLSSLKEGQQFYGSAILGFGTPCRSHNRICDETVRLNYEQIQEKILPNDIIVSSQAVETYIYLDRVDAMLIQKRVDNNNFKDFTSFQSPTDEYLGVEIVDSVAKLENLQDEARRVWVITYQSLSNRVSAEMIDVLESGFTKVYTGNSLKVYLNCKSPCTP